MSTTYSLGPSSSTSIPLYPDKDYSLGSKRAASIDRTAAGDLYQIIAGQYSAITIPVEHVPSSYAAIVNSWWDSQAKLLYFVTSGGVTEVHSVMIMGKEQPLGKLSEPDDHHFQGKIQLEGY